MKMATGSQKAKPQAGAVQRGFKRIKLTFHVIAYHRGYKDCYIRYIMAKAIKPGQRRISETGL